MKLSIIVPVYNVEKYIVRCIESLLNQNIDLKDYEILVIDDGSTDSSITVIAEYLVNYSNIFVYSQSNSGVSSARNKGIDLAKGEFIYFIDPDDYLAENVLNELIGYSEINNLEILTFNSKGTLSSDLRLSKNENISGEIIKPETGYEYIGKREYKNMVWWYLINYEFLKANKIRFIEGRWMEDALFTAQLFLKSNTIGYVDLDVHRHVITPNSAMTSKEPNQYLRVIRDNANAAEVFASIINNLDKKNIYYESCKRRLKTRQQSFVFFMMVRMCQSSIKLKEIKILLKKLEKANSYPLNLFIGEDNKKSIYMILVFLFNKKLIFYLVFLLVNPFFRFKNSILS